MAVALTFWTIVLIAATAAILFAFSACLGANAQAEIDGVDLDAAASPLLQ